MSEMVVAALGPGDAYSVQSTSNPQHCHMVFWSEDAQCWMCSCPAPHAALRERGRFCSTIAKVVAALSMLTPPTRHLQPVRGTE